MLKTSANNVVFNTMSLTKCTVNANHLPDREYKQVKLRGKTSYTQSSKYTMHKMWRENTQKYDLKQLKIINKA